MSQDVASELWKKAIELRGSNNNRKIKKAIKLVQRIIEERDVQSSISAELKIFVGDCYHIDLKQHDEAFKYYQMAVNEDKNNSWANIMLGEIYLKYKKDYKAAVEILEKTIVRGISSSFEGDIAKDHLADAKQKAS